MPAEFWISVGVWLRSRRVYLERHVRHAAHRAARRFHPHLHRKHARSGRGKGGQEQGAAELCSFPTRRTVAIRMALPTAEQLVWHSCETNITLRSRNRAISHCQNLLFALWTRRGGPVHTHPAAVAPHSPQVAPVQMDEAHTRGKPSKITVWKPGVWEGYGRETRLEQSSAGRVRGSPRPARPR